MNIDYDTSLLLWVGGVGALGIGFLFGWLTSNWNASKIVTQLEDEFAELIQEIKNKT